MSSNWAVRSARAPSRRLWPVVLDAQVTTRGVVKAQTEFALPVISKKGSVLRELNIDTKLDEVYIVMKNLKPLLQR